LIRIDLQISLHPKELVPIVIHFPSLPENSTNCELCTLDGFLKLVLSFLFHSGEPWIEV